MDIQLRRVDNDVAVGSQLLHTRALGPDTVEKCSVALKRVRTPHLLEATHQGGVGGLEENHTDASVVTQPLHGLFDIGEELATADVDNSGNLRQRGTRVTGEVNKRAEHLRREVVDHVPAEVFEGVADRRPPGARHARDDQHLLLSDFRGHRASGL